MKLSFKLCVSWANYFSCMLSQRAVFSIVTECADNNMAEESLSEVDSTPLGMRTLLTDWMKWVEKNFLSLQQMKRTFLTQLVNWLLLLLVGEALAFNWAFGIAIWRLSREKVGPQGTTWGRHYLPGWEGTTIQSDLENQRGWNWWKLSAIQQVWAILTLLSRLPGESYVESSRVK